MRRKQKIKVVIIEDSRLYQVYLERILRRDPQIEIGGFAKNAKEALSLLQSMEEKPDVITLDMGLPDVKEFELLEQLDREFSIPIIVVTALPKVCEKALSLGAADFIEKIHSGEEREAKQFAMLLTLKIKMLANSFVGGKIKDTVPVFLKKNDSERGNLQENLIVLGASLGGTEATLEVLKELPVWMPGIVAVQHMPAGFTKAYAMRLNKKCALEVHEARSGELVRPGTVLIAKGGVQLSIYKAKEGYRVRMKPGEEKDVFCPSVNVLFESAAKAAGKAAVGVILTGMGSDGAEGILQMHKAGAYTIGQDEESCAVFGMPKAAWEAGGLDCLLPCRDIAGHLKSRFARYQSGGNGVKLGQNT